MPAPPAHTDFRIGAVGGGFIMRDVQLVAYRKAGFPVAAIAAAAIEEAATAASQHSIPQVFGDYREMIASGAVDVLDIAVPPDIQPAVIEAALEHADKIRGILAQKPLAMTYPQALKLVEACERAGVTLAVNQNMRYDQSIRALATLLRRGDLGEPVLATIDMRAIPHWQPWLRDYPGLTFAAMSIHHLDTFRFLFGDPAHVYASARTDPRTQFPHRDGITLYILEYDNGFRASSWDDVWSGPSREGCAADNYIRWRVEGTEGTATGAIGWPGYPNAVPSTIRYTTRKIGAAWIAPAWNEVWFPDAFQGTMGELLDSLATGRPPSISGRENLGTIALVEACYRSLAEHRPVSPVEIAKGAHA
jgi:predicted dehydrogenase